MIQHSMIELEGWLALLGPVAFSFRNDAAPTPTSIDDLKFRLLEVQEEMETIQATADGEKRDLTDPESTEIERCFAEFKKTELDIDRRERMQANSLLLAASPGRQTEPGDLTNSDGDQPQARASSAPRIAPQPRDMLDRGRCGWRNIGDFAAAVRKAALPGGLTDADPRLIQNAATTFSTEGVGEDGGFAVPPEFRTAIMEKVMGEDSLIARTDQLTSSSNTLTIPADETTPWQSTGGIQAFWGNEGGAISQSKMELTDKSIRLNKLTALVPVTSELIDDAPALDSYLRRKTPEKMDYRVTDAILNGTGSGQPLGILNGAGLVTVSKESGQVADTLVFQNINNMHSRMYSRWRTGAIWLINQDIEPQLGSLNHPGDSSPVFMPPGGLSQAPFGTLMGKPIIPTEACQALGDAGDIIFVNLQQYMTVRKTSGIRAETSIHLWFDQDITAFRFILRVAGEPWWNSVIARANGANTLSAYVTLADRA